MNDERIIKWTRTFDPKVNGNSVCGTLRLEAQYQDDAGSWPADWKSLKSGVVDTPDDRAKVTVKPWGLTSGDKRSARVRLRCEGTQLFTVSEIFTVEKGNQANSTAACN